MIDELRSRVLALPAQDREELAYALLESLYAETSPDPVRLVGADRGVVPSQLRDSPLRDRAPLDGAGTTRETMPRDRANVVVLSEARARLLPS
jgi:hypothetical protein